MHGGYLRGITGDPVLVSALLWDYTHAEMDGRMRAILDYTAKLTASPWSVTQADVAALRSAGLDDRQVLSTALIAASYGFWTRLADGLGVEVTEAQARHFLGWLTGPAAGQAWLVHPK